MTKHEEHSCNECFNQPICKINDEIGDALIGLQKKFEFKKIPLDNRDGSYLHRMISFKATPLHLCSWFASIEERKKLAEEDVND